jgi:excisionase family DNA binding protein
MRIIHGPGPFTTGEAAAILYVHPKTLLNWVRDGRVESGQTPGGHHRFQRAELERLLRDGLPTDRRRRQP